MLKVSWACFLPLTILSICFGNITLSQTPPNDLLKCAAHFQARASWLSKVNGNKATITMMNIRSDKLMSHAQDSDIYADWAMVHGPYDSNNSISDHFVRIQTLTIMTDYAQMGYNGLNLPFCMEDSDCIKCNETFRTLQ